MITTTFQMDLKLWRDGAGQAICYLLGDDSREIALDELPIAIAKELESRSLSEIEVTIDVPVYANQCGSNDPASTETEPIVDGAVQLKLITVDRKDFDPEIFGLRVYDIIHKAAQEHAESNIDEIVSE